VVKVSGSIGIPASCAAGQCSEVQAALAGTFDSVTCTGSAGCECEIVETRTVENTTVFTVVDDVVTTDDGEMYSFCAKDGLLQYSGRSAGADEGVWALKKR
jgi:hypothetical protein